MDAVGVYTLNEAARYAVLPVATLRSWFIQRPDGQGKGPIFRSDFDRVDGDYAISFVNLIEAYVARFFRKEGVRPAMIRRAHQVLQEKLHTPHPFAHADLATNGQRIILELPSSRAPDKELVDAVSKQFFFSQMKLGRIRYGEITRLAEVWAISDGVSLNPKVNYGKPVIENTGVSTLSVARQYRANSKNAALVARLFKLTNVGVVNAYKFEFGLGQVAA